MNDQTATAVQSKTAQNKPTRLKKNEPARVKRILIVDDNEDNRYAMTYLLQDRGFEIQLAENGKIGIDVAKKFQPDLILMDVMMPTMDGYTATRKLKQSTDFADTPIIAMTAKVMAYDHAKVLVAGYDDYIAKPFSMEKVIKKIEYWLEK